MDLMNCVKGVKFKILSKSVGCSYVVYKTDKIKRIKIRNDGETIIVGLNGDYFLPNDIAPLGSEEEWI